MARPLRIEYPGACYHVTSRGNEQKDVFKSQKDREKFLSYLESATERYEAAIHAWCLMSNHYHLLLETPSGNLSQIMRHINGAYTTYFNIKRKRAGHLFQGRYKAILVEADAYAVELSRYIHLNPVRAGMVSRPEEYRWSSYQNYIGQVTAPPWLKRDLVLGSFHKNGAVAEQKYRGFVEDLLTKEYDSPLKGVVASTVLGSREFVQKITESHLAGQSFDRSLPASRKLISRPTLEEIVSNVTMLIVEREDLRRSMSIYSCQRYSGAKLKEIGAYFGISDAAVSQTNRRLVLKAEQDLDIRNLLDRIEKQIKYVSS